ncbi:MAG: glutamate synthase subunit beta, partial [Candidatus Omnitrophica bacterium]|nr:glutamate synthase subunit beta [Candidatus Omnitrophota bacterium]
MGETRGFLKFKRKQPDYRPVCLRIKDYSEVGVLPKLGHAKEQSSRCMDCGTPFCHWACPIANYIPEWNDFLCRGNLEKAYHLLSATNNFPEFTGRLCPAICEYACVFGINDEPVTIRENELAIVEYAFKNNIIRPKPPLKRTGKKIAVVGSGPAGLACADQMNKAGHNIVVFEKDDSIGGILRYGISDFKLEKNILDRRLKILEKEGIKFVTPVNIGIDKPAHKLLKDFDAICLATGSRTPRDLNIEGRKLPGIHFAMDYLVESNKKVCGAIHKLNIDAKGKKVVVIGGGDTGSDCVGTANRQGAQRVTQIELLPQPPLCRTQDFPWPKYPLLLKTSTSHEEGVERQWSVSTKKFIGDETGVKRLLCTKVDIEKDVEGRINIKDVKGSEFEIEADLVILAMGFSGPVKNGLIEELNLELDLKGNVKTNDKFMTSAKGVFSCGDMHRGQSLIVWAILEGRRAAYFID